MERFNLNKLSEVKGKEISNRFTALENWDTEVDVNEVWETIRENIKTSAKGSLGQCCPTFLCIRAQFTDAYGDAGATTLLLLLLVLLLLHNTTISTTS
jgi:hypothetical protein